MTLEEYIDKKGLAPKWPYDVEQQIDVVLEYAEQLEQDAEKAEAEVTRLRAALEQVEWTDHQGLLYCPWCGGVKPNHADDCPRQAALS